MDVPGDEEADQINGARHYGRRDEHVDQGPAERAIQEGTDFFPQDDGEHEDIDRRCQRCDQGQPAMLEKEQEKDAQDHEDQKGDEGGFQR